MKKRSVLTAVATFAALAIGGAGLAAPAYAAARSPQITASYVEVINDHANKCADVAGKSTTVGGIIHEWDCEDGSNQQWLRVGLGNGYDLLRNHNSLLCMGVRGHAPVEGAVIEQQTCDTTDRGQWWKVQVADSLLGYWLASGFQDMCLALSPNTSKNGTPVVLGFTSNTTAKYWHYQFSF